MVYGIVYWVIKTRAGALRRPLCYSSNCAFILSFTLASILGITFMSSSYSIALQARATELSPITGDQVSKKADKRSKYDKIY